MYSLPLVSSMFPLLGRLVISISLPTDDLDSDTLLFDSTQSSLFLSDDDDFLTIADATVSNPCAAAQDDLSFMQDGGTNLYSRDDHPQCLPPVNIGAEALQLFESPLDSLESNLLPLKGETPNDPPPPPYPGRLPDGVNNFITPKQVEDLGFQPFTGDVRIEAPDDSTCRELAAGRGNFNIEVCCNAMYVGYEVTSDYTRRIMEPIDAQTIANQDIAVIYNCICTTLFPYNLIDLGWRGC